jgi:hypothetical protein
MPVSYPMWANYPLPSFPLALCAPSSVAGWVLLGAAAACLCLAGRRENPGARLWLWWLLLGGALLAFRWPLIWLPHELHPDESQLLAGALTLRHDPMFWRSVDGCTAGPLDYFALLPAAFFPGITGYTVARLTATLLIWGMLVAAGETVALITNRPLIRMVVLPAAVFAAFTTSPEFLHYSTELVPGLLLALAVLMSVRQSIRPSPRNLWAVALLLGATPFAKLQAGPVAAGLGLLLLGFEFASGRSRNLGAMIIGALLPVLLVAALVTATGQGENLLIPYLLQNTFYAQNGRQPLGLVVSQQGGQTLTNGYLALWFAGAVIFCAATVILARHVRGRLLCYGLAIAGLLLLTAGCILAPGRPYHHYLNLLIVPLTLLTGVALGLALQARRGDGSIIRPAWPIGLFLLCCLLPQLVLRFSNRPDPFEYYNTVVTAPGPAHRQLVAAIKDLTRPGESLGVWGWRSSLYVETGLLQATRQAHTEFQLAAGPWQKYYLCRYYEDLVASAPPVFADATGPGNFRFNNWAASHEIYPLLRDWVGAHYQYFGVLDGVRLYVRRDRMPAAPRMTLPR